MAAIETRDQPTAEDTPRPAGVRALARGSGTIAFERVGAATVLRAVRAESPLRLLTPRNHGHAAWVFAATFGGGLVDGDTIDLDLTLAAGSTGLVGTQASTKVYRCPASVCRQRLAASVDAEALLVLIPDPVVCFADARYEQTIAVDLVTGASVILLDTFTAGRSARGERWQFARFASRLTVTRAGSPFVNDATILDAERGALIRIAGTSVEAVTTTARGYLEGLATLLGDDPFARKWRHR